jgi:menaquinone-dependent protoporphyrinogen oxidase
MPYNMTFFRRVVSRRKEFSMVTTLIVYASNHGFVRNCVDRLAARLDGRVMSVDLKKDSNPDPGNYDNVIVGGSIHAGRVQKSVRRFLDERSGLLKTKKLGLFLGCMEDGEKAEKEFKDSYPADLVAHAAATGIFGGEFDFTKLNFLEKAMVKKAAGVTASMTKLREDEIENFARKMES